jgi:hypothetical protein
MINSRKESSDSIHQRSAKRQSTTGCRVAEEVNKGM